MIAPFIIAFLIFGIEYILLDETKLNYLVDWSGPIFQFTSIHTAYSQTHDSNILYFWVFWLFAIPVFCLLFVLAACGLTIRNVGLSRGQVTGCLSLVLLLLFSLFGHSNFYVLNAKYAIYSPSVGGVFAYAFAFEAICFLGITPILKLFSFLFADRRSIRICNDRYRRRISPWSRSNQVTLLLAAPLMFPAATGMFVF